MAGIADKFDKSYENKSIDELATAPVSALQGVTDDDAEHLSSALNQDGEGPRYQQVLPLGPGGGQARRVASALDRNRGSAGAALAPGRRLPPADRAPLTDTRPSPGCCFA